MPKPLSTNNFTPLIKIKNLYNGFRQTYKFNEKNILLIHENDSSFLIENKCGHFGVQLDDAIIQDDQQTNTKIIICKQHGISFNLSTGEVVNRPWENCDPIRVIDVVYKDEMLGFNLNW